MKKYIAAIIVKGSDKMDILIYGAGKYCENLLKIVNHYTSVNVVGIADSNIHGEKYGYTILDILDTQEKIFPEAVIVIAMANASNALEIARRLENKGYLKIYLYLNKRKTFINDFIDGECIPLNHLEDMILPSIELHTVDFCNLNCKGCAHFSPLFEKKIPDFNIRIRDLFLLKELFCRILMVSLLGGEPLLNPELHQYLIEARKYFPNEEIQIITNGILLLKVDDKLLKIISENRITVVISEYEPTHKIIAKIEERLQKFQIDYSVREMGIKERFNRPLSIVANSRYNKKCISEGCTAICDGKIARCPTLLYINKFNEKFGQTLPDYGILDLMDYKDGQTLLNKLKEKVPLCKYCIDNEIKWEVCGKTIKIEDFAALD